MSSPHLQCAHEWTDSYYWITLILKKILKYYYYYYSQASSGVMRSDFFLWFLRRFIDVYSQWTSEISSESVCRTESRNMCIMSVESDLTELWLSEGVRILVRIVGNQALKVLNYQNCLLHVSAFAPRLQLSYAPLGGAPHSLKTSVLYQRLCGA